MKTIKREHFIIIVMLLILDGSFPIVSTLRTTQPCRGTVGQTEYI